MIDGNNAGRDDDDNEGWKLICRRKRELFEQNVENVNRVSSAAK